MPAVGQSTTTVSSADSEDSPVVYAVLGICATLILLSVGLAIWQLLMSIKLRREFNTPNKELLDLLDDTSNVITSANVQEKVGKLLAYKHSDGRSDVTKKEDPRVRQDVEEANKFLSSIPSAWEATAQVDGKLEIVNGARDEGKLPILKQTRVPGFNLHVNRTKDLYRNQIYLSAAPMPSQFVDTWEMIWREKIGLVVWVGRLIGRTGAPLMDAYINCQTGKSMTYGPFEVLTKNSFDRHFNMSCYDLVVKRQNKKRRIILIHAYEWLQESVSWAMYRDVKVIVQIKDSHLQQIAAQLPNVLFQCKSGTAGSSSICAVYIGCQTWLRCKKVNMLGIIKYIRDCRWKAFEAVGDEHLLFIVQLTVAHTIMYGLSKFIETGNLTMYDMWIKNTLHGIENKT